VCLSSDIPFSWWFFDTHDQWAGAPCKVVSEVSGGPCHRDGEGREGHKSVGVGVHRCQTGGEEERVGLVGGDSDRGVGCARV